jgi:hypothetical protein
MSAVRLGILIPPRQLTPGCHVIVRPAGIGVPDTGDGLDRSIRTGVAVGDSIGLGVVR